MSSWDAQVITVAGPPASRPFRATGFVRTGTRSREAGTVTVDLVPPSPRNGTSSGGILPDGFLFGVAIAGFQSGRLRWSGRARRQLASKWGQVDRVAPREAPLGGGERTVQSGPEQAFPSTAVRSPPGGPTLGRARLPPARHRFFGRRPGCDLSANHVGYPSRRQVGTRRRMSRVRPTTRTNVSPAPSNRVVVMRPRTCAGPMGSPEGTGPRRGPNGGNFAERGSWDVAADGSGGAIEVPVDR